MPLSAAAVDDLIAVIRRGGGYQSGLDRTLVESVVEHERRALEARISVNNDISRGAPVTRAMIWSEIGPLVARLAVLYPTLVGPPLAAPGKDLLAGALKAIVSHTWMATRYMHYMRYTHICDICDICHMHNMQDIHDILQSALPNHPPACHDLYRFSPSSSVER